MCEDMLWACVVGGASFFSLLHDMDPSRRLGRKDFIFRIQTYSDQSNSLYMADGCPLRPLMLKMSPPANLIFALQCGLLQPLRDPFRGPPHTEKITASYLASISVTDTHLE